ncbi:hypothetical protein [Moorena producens]|uniref:hypothetical protein n=1 Tax=Moorena producens TaxID=1155739 RepID=UPI0011EA689D|nr:hypothetical protein [Moorena producens]
MRYTLFFPTSDFRLPTSDFRLPTSEVPAPCSLLPKNQNLYLTSRRIAIVAIVLLTPIKLKVSIQLSAISYQGTAISATDGAT